MLRYRDFAIASVRRAFVRFVPGVAWPFEDSWTGGLALASVALGLWLRARGVVFGSAGFGVDEATWTVLTLERPLAELAMRPAGFIVVSTMLAELFGPTETTMRLLPWVAGTMTVLLTPALARRLFASGTARLLFVAVIALHPAAIDFSREYKPYSMSLALHIALALLALRYSASGRSRDLAWLLGVSTLGGLFAQDLVFAYPGVFLVAVWKAVEQRRAHFAPIIGAALVIVGVLLLQYFLLWSDAEDAEFWGSKYGVFFEGKPEKTYLGWLRGRLLGLVAFPGLRDTFWHADGLSSHAVSTLRRIDQGVWLALHVMGLVSFWLLRRTRHALLLLLPLFVFWAFNLARVWPFGVFRANLFVLAYLAAIAASAFDTPAATPGRPGEVVPALALVIVPLFALDPGWHGQKRKLANRELDFPPVLEFFANRERAVEREIVLNHRTSCDSWRYYAEYHPSTAPRFGAAVADLDVRCVSFDADIRTHIRTAVATGRPTWFVGGTRYAVRQASKVPGTRAIAKRVGSQTVVAIERDGPRRRRRAAPRSQGFDHGR